MNPQLFNWDTVDWHLQDSGIARKLGCSRERVRQMRNKLGAPQSPFYKKHPYKIPPSILKAKELNLNIKGMYAQEIVRALHVCRNTVRCNFPDRIRYHGIDWTAIDFKVLSDQEIASATDRCVRYVARQRRLLGIFKRKKYKKRKPS